MIDSCELLALPMAQTDRLDDVQLGMLLDALQLGAEITADPEQLRRAIALFARAELNALLAC